MGPLGPLLSYLGPLLSYKDDSTKCNLIPSPFIGWEEKGFTVKKLLKYTMSHFGEPLIKIIAL